MTECECPECGDVHRLEERPTEDSTRTVCPNCGHGSFKAHQLRSWEESIEDLKDAVEDAKDA